MNFHLQGKASRSKLDKKPKQHWGEKGTRKPEEKIEQRFLENALRSPHWSIFGFADGRHHSLSLLLDFIRKGPNDP